MGKLAKLVERGRVLVADRRLGFVLPVLIGAVLRLARLGAQDLWYDEAATAWFARLPVRALMQAVAGDVHPPLWYLIEKVSVCFLGNTAFALRLPAALFSIAALALMPRLALALTPPPHAGEGSRVGVVATWIMALSPFQIWYAQEARMYTLILLAVEILAFSTCIRDKITWHYVVGVSVLLYTHNVGIVYIVILMMSGVSLKGIVCAALLQNGIRVKNYRPKEIIRPTSKDWVLFFLPFVLYIPWLQYARQQGQAVSQAFWVQRPTIGAIPLTLHELFWNTISPAWLGVFVVFLSGLSVIAAIWAGVKGRRWTWLYFAFAPLLAVWVVSQVTPVLITRLMIGCTPFIALLIALALVEHKRARWLALAAAPVVALVLTLYFFDPATQKGDVGRFVEPVQASYRPGDAVLHTCIPSYILLSYYAPELDHYLWRQAGDLSQSLSDQTKQAMGMRETTIEELLQAHARVWVYYSDSPVTAQAELDENARIRAAYGVDWQKGWSVAVEQTDLIESGVYLVHER